MPNQQQCDPRRNGIESLVKPGLANCERALVPWKQPASERLWDMLEKREVRRASGKHF